MKILLLPLPGRPAALSDPDMPPPTHPNGHASTASATSTVIPKLPSTPETVFTVVINMLTSFTLQIGHVHTPTATESRAEETAAPGTAAPGTTLKGRYKMFWDNADAAWMATSWLGMIVVDAILVAISLEYVKAKTGRSAIEKRRVLKVFLHLHFWFGWFVFALHGSILLWPATARKGPGGFTCGTLLWEGSLAFIGALCEVVCVRGLPHATLLGLLLWPSSLESQLLLEGSITLS